MEYLIYVVIFLQKIIENALSSFRAIVYTAGHKHLGALIIGINTLIWIVVITIILKDLNDDPIKIVIYGLGQVFGNYIGIVIEEKLAIGDSLLYIIIRNDNEKEITENLRKDGFGVTSIQAKGYTKNKKSLLLIVCKRKQKKQISEIVKTIDSDYVMMSKNPTNFKGGYVTN